MMPQRIKNTRARKAFRRARRKVGFPSKRYRPTGGSARTRRKNWGGFF